MFLLLPLYLGPALMVATEPPPALSAAENLGDVVECTDSIEIAIFNAPRRPHVRAPMKVLLVSERELPGVTVVVRAPKAPKGSPDEVVAAEPHGGPPWGWIATVPKPTKGIWRVGAIAGGKVVACQEVEVRNGPSGMGTLEVGTDPWWETRIKWERDTENLYSLWIEHLFDAPVDSDITWNPLAVVLKDQERNLLYDYLGMQEDKDGMRADPDCADFPYTLRAYFAWKLGLPMGFRQCRRGNAERAPSCGQEILTNEEPTEESNRVQAFKGFMRKLQATVHSSSLRGAPNDQKSDFYPVKLERRSLRPGTIYADPYGHTMMVGRWYPQTADTAGVLMAIDAQPDGTVGRRVFWRGSFMFPEDGTVAGAGWKRFRPVRRTGGLTELDNDAINQSIDYGDQSTEQWSWGKDGFYEAMDVLINPRPMAPEKALDATIDALEQQVLRRVESIDAVETWRKTNPKKVIPMPDGTDIFLTAGPWEDFSTPARDMRILIAIDTVKAFPARIAKVPKRFVLAPGEDIPALQKRMQALIDSDLASRKVTYHRSDGSPWTITLADMAQRTAAIEVAWNPNDCPEARWGAPEGSDEMKTCTQRSPPDQLRKLEVARQWFHARERPIQE
ncbi:MAG: hypothetical protein U1F43_21690 [Myxococcota bacterium]